MVIDTHCHLDFPQFEPDLEEVITRATESGVERIIVPAVDLDSARRIIALAERHSALFAAVGVHPNSSSNWKHGMAVELRSLAEHPKVVAIGEIGLDFYRDRSSRATQQQAFESQLEIAAELSLPVIVHNREADDAIWAFLQRFATERLHDRPGVLHSFSTGWQMAHRALAAGYYLGFTGSITYPKAEELRNVARQAPLDRILVETDAPYLAPQNQRGKRNEPAYVWIVVEKLAELRGVPAATIAEQTTANALRLFGSKLGPSTDAQRPARPL